MSEIADPIEGDWRARRRVQFVTTAALLLAFAAGSAFQASLLAAAGQVIGDGGIRSFPRLLASLLGCAVILVGVALPAIARLSWVRAILPLVLVCLTGGAVRALVLIAFGVHGVDRLDFALVDSIAPAVTTLLSVGVGLFVGESVRRLRVQQRAGFEQTLRDARMLEGLENDERRERKRVADDLHASMQERLRVIAIRLRALRTVLADRSALRPEERDELGDLSAEVDLVREADARGYRGLLVPAGLEAGLAHAVRSVLRHVAADVAVTTAIDASVGAAEGRAGLRLDLETRVLAIRILEAGVADAVARRGAQALAVAARVEGGAMLQLEVSDDGIGPVVSPQEGAGTLALLRTLVAARGGRLTRHGRPEGGVSLRAAIPLAQPAAGEGEGEGEGERILGR